MWFLIGILLGAAFGVLIAAWIQANIDKDATETGLIKLCGRYFSLTEIDL